MKLILQHRKPVSIFLIIAMLSFTVPYQTVLAAMIRTETVIDSARTVQARDQINNLLLREDFQNALKAQGINPQEAKARIDSLSDAEVVRLADQIDKLPAGGVHPGVQGFVIIVAAVVLIIVGLIYLANRATSD